MNLVEIISLRIRELRRIHGITQQEASELVGVSMRFYQALEAGRKKEMWTSTIERLAAAFGLEPWQLIYPALETQSKLQKDVVKSTIHYQRRCKEPPKKDCPRASKDAMDSKAPQPDTPETES